jgi:phosphoribosylanthranilate isomerase
MYIKVCGIKYPETLQAISALQPDFMGFILYPRSARYMRETLLPEQVHAIKGIQKTGVWVNESPATVIGLAELYGFDYVQLHGQESPDTCAAIRQAGYGVIKVFSVGETFDPAVLDPYTGAVDYFLFDTAGRQPGGNGVAFDWGLLQDAPITVPWFLSGGLGPEHHLLTPDILPAGCAGLDINSRFETEPGRKDPERVAAFIQAIRQHHA